MKRTTFIVAGLALVAAAYVGSQLLAQGQPQASAPAQTRIALLNISALFQKYDKAAFFKTEMENMVKPYRDEQDKLKKIIIDWKEALQKNPKLSNEDRKRGEDTIIQCTRRIEDLQKEMVSKVGKKQEDMIVQLYGEASNAVKAYAAANGFHIVLGYAEPPENELFHFGNITRKLQGMEIGGGLSPLYSAPGIDITQAVVGNLNLAYKAASAGGKQ